MHQQQKNKIINVYYISLFLQELKGTNPRISYVKIKSPLFQSIYKIINVYYISLFLQELKGTNPRI